MFVSAELIRALEPTGSLSRGGGGGGGGGALREGMKVEARYRGKARYYPGIIKREVGLHVGKGGSGRDERKRRKVKIRKEKIAHLLLPRLLLPLLLHLKRMQRGRMK